MAVVVSMAKDNGRDVHPFFLPKTNARHSTHTGLEASDKHRKRQRTQSPDQETAVLNRSEANRWVDQLNAAAYGALQEPDIVYRPTSNRDESDVDKNFWNPQRRGSNGTTLPVDCRNQNGSSAISSRPVNADMSLAEEMSQSSDPNPDEKSAKIPSKKMLRVRPDGKLGSPKAKAPAQDGKPKRGRKPGKANAIPNTLVVSIRYGVDKQSRFLVGHKIADIFSDTVSNLSPAEPKPPKPNRPPEPPKPTHPFFLGGPNRDQCQQELAQSNKAEEAEARDHPTTSKPRVVSPTKGRVTTKPPGVSGSSAKVFELGGNTLRGGHAPMSQLGSAMEPLWPPEGMVHVRLDYESAETALPNPLVSHDLKARRKMKEAEIRIPSEELVLKPYIDVVHAYHSDGDVSRRVHSREWREFRRPLRRILTGRELQQAVRREIASKLPGPYQDTTDRQDGDGSSTQQMPPTQLHPALQHMYKEIATSLTAFDKYECENEDWVHKYAPARADQVLQIGREVFILRDWLKTLTINSVDFRAGHTSKTRDSSVSSRKAATKRKKRRAEELDGFVLSSDEEASEMCQITDPEDRHYRRSMLRKSVICSRDARHSRKGERVTNAVVISGPHGCGKTAAVHAVAQELGFEVFEINAGSRRSGRDIVDKVGDMTRNHLVTHAHSDQGADAKENSETMDLLNEKLKQDLDSGRQGTMKSFFRVKGEQKKNALKPQPKTHRPSPKQDPPRKHQSQKQSLILLEEVDVLFDEDKAFWATTLDLLEQSKRPVIMTCTDESLLPLESMDLYAILRFVAAPEQLATDYLLLVACNEGHLLPRNAVSNLYKSKDSDLRASMTELNFFCQMAVGDAKGGLEWMLMKPPSINSHGQNEEPLRVVSEGAYQSHMSWLHGACQTFLADRPIDREAELLSEAWYRWGLDFGSYDAYMLPLVTQEESSRKIALRQLQLFDQGAENLSAADILPGRIPPVPNMVLLDTAQPELSEKARSNFVEGLDLLQADPVIDQSGVTEAIAFITRACARLLMHPNYKQPFETTFDDETIINTIAESMEVRHCERGNKRIDYAAVFEPIARSERPVLGISKGPQISAFDGSLSVITEDLAPYIRSIVSYDLRLEEQRRKLSSLPSQSGQRGKRQRTTRASRAALEGGNKAYTRRERWFPNNSNLDAILQSGGQGWQDIAAKQPMNESSEPSEDGTGLEEEPRRTSTGSVEGHV